MMQRRKFLWFFVLLVGLTAVAMVTPYLYNVSQLLQPERVEAARQRWQEKGLADYEFIRVEKVSQRKELIFEGAYHVKVVGGQLTEVRFNGEKLNLERLTKEARDTFTVPGMFRKIEKDLTEDMGSGKRRNYINCYFDPKTGCPLRYVHRVRADNSRLEWIVKLNP